MKKDEGIPFTFFANIGENKFQKFDKQKMNKCSKNRPLYYRKFNKHMQKSKLPYVREKLEASL